VPLEVQLVTGLMIALVVAFAATPLAVRVAHRFEFFDKPFGYKGHATPTPYLGGAAVVTAFVVASLIVAGNPHRTVPVVIGAVILWGVGTVDDRRNLSPYLRLAVEFALAAGLWALGLGWDLGFGAGVDLAVTCLWIAGVVNAFNLFDNMDGAASTMAAVVAGAVAVLGAVLAEPWLAAAGAALCGACLGFLPHNLARPARIFLGDGGSMPVGFVAASLVMIGASDAVREWQALAIALLLVGVPLLDTTLVVISRRRRGIPILTGGRDHLTHRTRQRIANVRAVAVALGGAQAMLAAFALLAYRGGSIVLVIFVALYVLAAAAAIEFLDGDFGESERLARHTSRSTVRPADALVAVLGVAFGLSSFYDGGYDASLWAPAGVVLLALLIAVAIARFPRLNVVGRTAVGSLGVLAVWALISGSWSSSPAAAAVFGNRWLVYTVVLALLTLLIRDRRGALWVLGGVVAGTLAVALWTVGSMLIDSTVLFAGGRLNDPLGYVNGQGAVYAMALIPCLVLADWRRTPWLSALGASLASLFAGLAILSQSRGVWLGMAVAIMVLFVVAPQRRWRLALVLIIAAALALASPWLNDVYTETVSTAVPERVARRAAVVLLAAALLAGALWYGAQVASIRLNATARSRIGRWWTSFLVAVGVLAAVTALVSLPRIVDKMDDQYQAFVTLDVDALRPDGHSRLLSTSGVRYDYWRIAVRAWEDHPVAGLGAGGYPVSYFRQRRTVEDIRQPHSLGLQVLAELGVVGALLFLAWLGALCWGVWRWMRAGSRTDRLVTAAGAGLFAAWLSQTSGDWLHLLAGVTGVALVGAAVLLRPLPEEAESPGPARRQVARTTRLFAVAGVAVAVAVLVLLSRQALSEHYRVKAQAALAAQHPADALALADRSLRLQGNDVDARYLRSAALERLGQTKEARLELLDALDREPDNFVTWALLGDLDARLGNVSAARHDYREALRLNPLEPSLAEAVKQTS
jgi:UDP-GlcNAc:undecaprenyl-phosphate GlcNAc-1-phosphate transferase